MSQLWVDAVEKVGGAPLARNNRIATGGSLNRYCVFDTRLESMSLQGVHKIVFQQYRSDSENLRLSKSSLLHPHELT
jgi:hypothetical protein